VALVVLHALSSGTRSPILGAMNYGTLPTLGQADIVNVVIESKERRCQMDEHDDDLESGVHEDAEQETDDYPNTGNELDEPLDLDEGDAPLDDESDLSDSVSCSTKAPLP
jgi:hypothetical protein